MIKAIKNDYLYELTTVAVYCAIGWGLSCFASCLNSEFVHSFSSEIIPLLATILTVNVASSILLAGKVVEIQKLFPEANFDNTYSNTIAVTVFQIVLIGLIFITSIVVNGERFKDCQMTSRILDSISIGAFIYFLNVIYDMFLATISIFKFAKNDQ